ncbi:hypothetical protein GFD17_00545 [Bifidobacterium sp. SMB2]|uniref:Uncharacterized protein n=1 Tax=Bifidobacterium saimiriisciurei TaxID=2661627 RepID=A0ABX0C876_9BIFI|nr:MULTISPECIES: hypothetical protein [Bifidobacterium]NEG95271.1 hypothetical protein [Bifidobacterium sp. SMB2]NEH11348.1 hypothetical protein [Bifidobacterium saimiriisciurei]
MELVLSGKIPSVPNDFVTEPIFRLKNGSVAEKPGTEWNARPFSYSVTDFDDEQVNGALKSCGFLLPAW